MSKQSPEKAAPHPLPLPETDLVAGSQTVRIIQQWQRDERTITYEVEPTDRGKRLALKIPAPTSDPRHAQERRNLLAEETRVMRLLNRLEQVPSGSHRHIPLVEPADSIQFTVNGTGVEIPALLIELARGENLDALLQKESGLGEATALRIGCQLSEVMMLAHLGNFHYGDPRTGRLFWDSHHLMIVDWQVDDITHLPDHEREMKKQEDARNLARILFWILTGQPFPPGGLSDADADPDPPFSMPLRKLLERATGNPASFGDDPVPACRDELVRLLGYWQAPRIYPQVREDIQETRRRIQFLAQSTSPRSAAEKIGTARQIDDLYDQIAIGRLREAKQPWDTLEQTLSDLWTEQLTLIRHEIEAGHHEVAGELIERLSSYPRYPQEIFLPLLWRQRVVEACRADPYLATQGSQAARAIAEWDQSTYNLAAWVTVDQKLLDTLSPPARDSIINLRAELWVISLVERFHETPLDQVDERLSIISKLSKSVPPTIEPRIAAARKQVCDEQPRLEAQQRRLARTARLNQLLERMAQAIQSSDPTISEADFDTALELCISPEDRRRVYAMRSSWKQVAEIWQWLEDGAVTEAVRRYASLEEPRNPNLEQRIVTAVLNQAGLTPGGETTFGEAFDRLVNQPVGSPGDLQTLLQWSETLLPVVAPGRRKKRDELVARKEQIVEILNILNAEQASPEQRIRALNTLQSLGLSFLSDKLLSDAYGASNAELHEQQFEQLETVARQLQTDMQSLRQTATEQFEAEMQTLQRYESAIEHLQSRAQSLRQEVTPIRSGFFEREVAEVERLMPSKEAQQRHHQLWEHTAPLARAFVTLSHQRDYFHAKDLLTMFQQRCPDDIIERLANPDAQELATITALAKEIARLTMSLAESPYGAAMTQLVEEQRKRLDSLTTRLLAFNPRKDDLDLQAHNIVAARRLLSIYDTLSIGGYDQMYWSHDRHQYHLIATYLRSSSPSLRRVMLRQLSPDTDMDFVSRGLEQPVPGKRWQMAAYIGGAVMLLLLVVIIIIGLRPIPGTQNAAQGTEPQAAPATPELSPTGPTAQTVPAASSAITATTAPDTPVPTATTDPMLMLTEAPLQTPSLLLQTNVDKFQLYPGQAVTITLFLDDTNDIAEAAALSWQEPPEGITIQGSQTIPLPPEGSAFDVGIAVASQTPPGARTLSFTTTAGDSATPSETGVSVEVVVRELPTVMTTALAVEGYLQQSRTIMIERSVTLRSEPRLADETRLEVLPPETLLTILRLPEQDNFLNVRSEIDGKVGWVTTRRDFTTYDPETLPIQQYPLSIALGHPDQPEQPVTLHQNDATTVPVAPQQAELISVIPRFQPESGQVWLNVRLGSSASGPSLLEGWVLMEDTNYEAVLRPLAERAGVGGEAPAAGDG
ncbi:MAG: hypothetical protein HC884_07130 [Chloroflexaceae bacterium]|nr:hypothetical protein [Chloroflexaceae bacterium]